MQNENTIPKLAPPGAGIPWPQRMVLQFVIAPFVAGRTDWKISQTRFDKLTAKILREAEEMSEAQMLMKVLVPPQSGLEDSSRFWSVAMVLEHLVIVGRQMNYAITELVSGRNPEGKADTAAVKPFGAMSAKQSLEDFKKFTDTEYKNLVKYIGSHDHNSQLKFLHPWFGKITAKQWFWVLTIHHGLHLKQIRNIKACMHATPTKGGGVSR